MSLTAALAMALVFIGLLTGGLIGGVGVGGVLLAPLLVLIGGLDLHSAMATSSFSFISTGIVGTLVYGRRGSVDRRSAAWLAAPVLPGAILGAGVNSQLSAGGLTVVLVLLLTWSGLHRLISERRFPAARRASPSGLPALPAIGISQVVQLPIALFSTVGFGLAGNLQLLPGLLLGVVQAAGVVVGARISHSLPAASLSRVVAYTLLGVAGLLLIGLA